MKENEINWLTDRLNELKLSKNKFAQLMGIHAQHANRFACLKPKLYPSQLKRLARILQCSFNGLLEFWDDNITADELWKYREKNELIEFDEKLLHQIIVKLSEWEETNEKEISSEDKAILIKLIYQRIMNNPQLFSEDDTTKLIDFYEYAKAAKG